MTPEQHATVIVNGQERPMPREKTGAALLAALGLDAAHVVVEVNGGIIARERVADCPLNAGDTIEIIHFVGGG